MVGRARCEAVLSRVVMVEWFTIRPMRWGLIVGCSFVDIWLCWWGEVELAAVAGDEVAGWVKLVMQER